MKIIAMVVILFSLFSVMTGCQSRKAEKEAYYEEGKMDEQVQSWKTKPGGRY
ncbi:hypothetical protein PDESU_01394 [Pontiella desulfatans]|uniref:Lipoprotein n=1 Tax=Pontiella desulfatans TaxID=2750659 RepID=A0A6C2TYT0_PONDE|nr:hypothetical protein [Pontiella desulfatans]VGO12840.1 hypothetical protein PDESU_01394 [Pontiella desulfatans]